MHNEAADTIALDDTALKLALGEPVEEADLLALMVADGIDPNDGDAVLTYLAEAVGGAENNRDKGKRFILTRVVSAPLKAEDEGGGDQLSGWYGSFERYLATGEM